MRGAYLVYNGIKIALTKTNSITVEAQYTPDGVDYLFTKVTINVDGIINPYEMAYAGSPPVETVGALPSTTFPAVRGLLMSPKGELTFDSWNQNVLTSPLQNYSVDANNGPFPQACTITRLVGDKTWHVNYIIVTYIYECPANSDLPVLISNRFSQSQDVDFQQKQVITTSGVAYFRIDLLSQQGLIADAFRDQVLPPVPFGYRRSRVRVGVNTEGNALQYEATDEEVMLNLGDTGDTGSQTYIAKLEGTFNVSTIKAEKSDLPGGITAQSMNVRLWGSIRASNWILTQLAFQIIQSKLTFGNPKVASIMHMSMTQSLADRFVDVTIVQRVLQVNKAAPMGVINTSGLAQDNILGPNAPFQGRNPGPPKDNGTRGYNAVTLLSSAIKESICSQVPSPDCVGNGGNVAQVPYCGPAVVVQVFPANVLPQNQDRYSSRSQNGMYTESTIDSYIETHHGVYQSPLADKGDANETCSILTLHQPYSRRVVNWEAERIGSVPMIPSFVSSDTNQVLMESTINPAELLIIEDGQTPTFKVTGRYVYAMKTAMPNLTQIAFDVPQWIDYPYGDSTAVITLPTSSSSAGGNFTHGIIDPGTQS